MTLTNISNFDPATGRTTTLLVDCHTRGAKDYYCELGAGNTGCFACAEPDPDTHSLPVDVAHFTIAQIQAWVDDHEAMAQTVLNHEMARGPDARSTLITWLEGFIAANDDDDTP